jgi:hypothetical protein
VAGHRRRNGAAAASPGAAIRVGALRRRARPRAGRGRRRSRRRPRAHRRVLAALTRRRHRSDRPPARAGRRRRGRDADAVERASAGPCVAADPRVPGRDRGGGRPPDRGHRCAGPAADDRGQPAPATARRRPHELHRGHALERVGRRDQRDRHGDSRRSRRAGLRPRALQRSGPALDVLGGAHPRPRHRCRARRDRPDRRLLDRPAAQPRGRDSHRPGGRGVAAAGDAGARSAPARPLRRPGRRLPRLARARHPERPAAHGRPEELGHEGEARDPARRRPPHAALRCGRDRGVRGPGRGGVRGPRRHARLAQGAAAPRPPPPPPGRSSASSSSGASGRSSSSTATRPSCGPVWARSSRCSALIPRG